MDEHPKNNFLRSRLKKILTFFVNFFGKKSRKSFSAIISYLLEDYRSSGILSNEEKKIFKNIINFADKKVSDIMTPRSDMISINHNLNFEEVKKIVVSEEHTRIPIYKDSLEEVIGFLHSKDLAKFMCYPSENFSLSKIMRKILFVPGSMKIMDVMLRMRIARVHIAIVLDEFGGVAGLVTIENIVEEIVGEIEDEHDIINTDSFFSVRKTDENTVQIGGRVEVKKLEELLNCKITSATDDYNTISGLVMSLFSRVPQSGEEIEQFNLKFRIIDSDNRLVKLVEVKKMTQQELEDNSES